MGRDVVALGEELGDQAVLLFAAPLELDDLATRALHLLDRAQNLVLDELKDLIRADGQPGRQLATGQMMKHVHHLEHDASLGTALAFLGCHEQKVTRRHPHRHVLGYAETKIALEVLDGLFAQVFETRDVIRVGRVDFVDAQEAIDLLAIGEVQTVPIDDRSTA